MTKELNIHQRLHAVMKDIDYVQKEDKKVNNQYKFVSHDAVTAKCRKAFVEHGILSVPTVLHHTRERATEKKKEWVDNKPVMVDAPILRTSLEVSVAFINIDKPDEIVTTVSFGEGVDNQDKGIGKAYSYAVKYAYLKVLGLETGDDPERDLIDTEPTSPIKAVGGSMKNGIDDDMKENAYNTAISKLNECKSLVELQKTFKPYAKQGIFSDEQWKAIGDLKDKLKEKLPNVEKKK